MVELEVNNNKSVIYRAVCILDQEKEI